MPRNRLDLGLDDWIASLTDEPAALASAAAPILQTAADDAAQALRAAYPSGPTGNLRAGVRVQTPPDADPAVATAELVSGAPHAHLYEDGTRYSVPHPTFYPIADEYARAMQGQVTRVVQDAGYNVTGNVD